MAYAEKTEVAFDKSISQIVALVRAAGAESLGQMESPGEFMLGFQLAGRMIRFKLPLPALEDMPKRSGNNVWLTDKQRLDRLAQAKRSRGRALMLVIKAKLESVESGIETAEEAFLSNVVGADGQTVYERIKEPLAVEYQQGKAITLLPAPGN